MLRDEKLQSFRDAAGEQRPPASRPVPVEVGRSSKDRASETILLVSIVKTITESLRRRHFNKK